MLRCADFQWNAVYTESHEKHLIDGYNTDGKTETMEDKHTQILDRVPKNEQDSSETVKGNDPVVIDIGNFLWNYSFVKKECKPPHLSLVLKLKKEMLSRNPYFSMSG